MGKVPIIGYCGGPGNSLNKFGLGSRWLVITADALKIGLKFTIFETEMRNKLDFQACYLIFHTAQV